MQHLLILSAGLPAQPQNCESDVIPRDVYISHIAPTAPEKQELLRIRKKKSQIKLQNNSDCTICNLVFSNFRDGPPDPARLFSDPSFSTFS